MTTFRFARIASLPYFVLLALLLLPAFGTTVDAPPDLKLIGVSPSGVVKVLGSGQHASLREGEAVGPWTLMAILQPTQAGKSPSVVFENFRDQLGHLLLVDARGAVADLPKSLEPTSANPLRLYRGHTLNEVIESDHDLLGGEILAKPGDPEYDEVAVCLPPITKTRTYTFVGTHESIDKLGFQYGGRSPSFDPSPYDPEIVKIRKERRVWDGLVGGWLPIRWMLVFEDPASETVWLAKGTPSAWLEDNKTISVSEAPTRWGRVGYSLTSRLSQGKVEALITLPASGFAASVKLRVRVHLENTIRSMTVNGKPWTEFDSSQGTVTLPPHSSGEVAATINYR